METLHELEINILKTLQQEISIDEDELKVKTGLDVGSFRKAIGWLTSKGLIKEKITIKNLLKPSSAAIKYASKGLPEKQLLKLISVNPQRISTLRMSLTDGELNNAMGYLKKNHYIDIEQGLITPTQKGLKTAHESDRNQDLLQMFLEKEYYLEQLPQLVQDDVKQLLERREILTTKEIKERTITITELGQKINVNEYETLITKLTSTHLKRKQVPKLRSFDINTPVKSLNRGKKHPYKEFLKQVEDKLIQLGFEEMRGNLVENEFWNMDALFMPQFHSARDIHDAYYVKNANQSKPLPSKIFEAVKKSHEKNWKYEFSETKTRNLLLRSQGTANSARTLANNPKIPGKYYSIARCFRYDVIDKTHLPDFEQVEGIILDPKMNFKKLLGILEMFAKEIAGAKEVKFRPGYFPFTEPSVEMFVKHPQLGWIELGGAGIFRPELTKPLGINVPVIAWGLGIGRIAMLNMKTNDIRNLISQDLDWLRNAPIIKEI